MGEVILKKYDVKVLKEMIDVESNNIRMFQGYGEYYENRVSEMVKYRRNLAALVENDGVEMEGVYVDLMSYSAQAGADTSWWG